MDVIFLQRFSCNACTVEAGSHSSRSSRRIAGRDRAAGQSGQDGRRGGGSSSETRGAFRASARRRTDHQHATGGPRQVRAELQYWVLVLRWRDRAITMHRPSDTFDTCWLRNWHRHWLVVWSSPGSTTAMLCSTALPATASRSCSECRTTQLGSFSKHQDDPTLTRCWGRYTGCPFSIG